MKVGRKRIGVDAGRVAAVPGTAPTGWKSRSFPATSKGVTGSIHDLHLQALANVPNPSYLAVHRALLRDCPP
jgi:hypothetical protein